jgi:signal transduction histidine kinase
MAFGVPPPEEACPPRGTKGRSTRRICSATLSRVGELSTPTIAALLRLGSLAGHDWEETLQEILLVTSDVLNVARVSYWRFREEPPSIVCDLGYQSHGQRFERGLVLREKDAAPYLRAVKSTQVMAVEDARSDPRTNCLNDYLQTTGVGSLLDTAIRAGKDLIGILCIEHMGGTRSWSSREQEFAFAVTQILSARLESNARDEAEARVQQIRYLSDVSASMAETFEPIGAARLATEGAIPELGDYAAVLVCDGNKINRVSETVGDRIDVRALAELQRRYPPDLHGPGFAMHAMRERQTLFLPRLTAEVAKVYGYTSDDFVELEALGTLGIIAVPFLVRGELTGAMLFGTARKPYHQSDVDLVERYAGRVALMMENAILYQRAQEAIRVRDQFLSMASHELRTPVTSLRLFAEKLAQKAPQMSVSMVTGLSDRILQQASRLERMMDRLLDSCEISAGSPSIERVQTDLGHIVDDVVHTFSGMATRAGSELVVSVRGSVVGCWDPLRIEQIVANLVDNAIKFGGGKPIHIDVEAGGARARLSVRDEGLGISRDEEKHVFDRYWRAPGVRNHGGLGLGLYVAKEMAEAHGGAITVESTPGAGSKFTLELPIEEREERHDSHELRGG